MDFYKIPLAIHVVRGAGISAVIHAQFHSLMCCVVNSKKPIHCNVNLALFQQHLRYNKYHQGTKMVFVKGQTMPSVCSPLIKVRKNRDFISFIRCQQSLSFSYALKDCFHPTNLSSSWTKGNLSKNYSTNIIQEKLDLTHNALECLLYNDVDSFMPVQIYVCSIE